MAPHCHSLSPYAAQRLVTLFDMLARKYTRLAAAAAAAGVDVHAPGAEGGGGGGGGGGDDGGDSGDGDSAGAGPAEMHIYADFLRIVLEIINSTLTYALPNNPEVGAWAAAASIPR
jgi:hypothetical protein